MGESGWLGVVMRIDPDEGIARGLAWALLAAAEWDKAALTSALGHALGRRHRWIPKVVTEVLAAYPRAPIDRPHELTRFLRTGTSLVHSLARARRQGRAVRLQHIPMVTGTMGLRHWPVPEIDDLGGLALLLELPLEQLIWAADTQGRQRATRSGPLHLYRHTWRPRPGAAPRLLESPTPLLRAVLRRVLDRILVWVPVHPAAHGFVPGRSAPSNARAHVGADVVICLDLRTFFTSITAARVNGLFRVMGYPEPVAWTLAALCTHQTPAHVLAAMPAGGDSTVRHRQRAELRVRHLPQGSPTSPALANLAAHGLDRRLAGLADRLGLTYTRYADDLTFSGSSGNGIGVPRLVGVIGEIVRNEGFVLNTSKTRVRHAGERHEITGLVTNQQLSVPRAYHDQLRAVLHDAVMHGPAVANRAGLPNFRDHLAGRVGWVESVNPVRGRRLRAQFDAIAWPD